MPLKSPAPVFSSRFALLLGAALVLDACGGGGGSTSTPVGAPASFQIAWGARSRTTEGPSSALSAVLTLKGSGASAATLTKTVDRASGLAAYVGSYATDSKVKPGVYSMNVRLFAGTGGTGALVAQGAASMTIGSDGIGIGTVGTMNAVATVAVVPSQSVTLAEDGGRLAFSAKDAQGNVLALTPGSAHWVQVDGGAVATVGDDGAVTTKALGTATVKVVVDGKTSESATFAVPPASVTVKADQTVPYAGVLQLALEAKDAKGNVIEAPAGLASWSLKPGTGEGFLTLGSGGLATSTHSGSGALATATILGVTSPERSIAVAKAPLKSVTVVAGQSVTIGVAKQLALEATDMDGKPFDLSGLEPAWSVVAGNGVIDLTPFGRATGKSGGAASVKVSVGNVASETATVTVAPGFLNPSFETDTQSWSGQGAWGIGSDGGHTGSRYGLLLIQNQNHNVIISQRLTGLTVGATYRLTFWRSGPGATMVNTIYYAPNVNFPRIPTTLVETSGAWSKYSATFTAAATEYSIEFEEELNSASGFYGNRTDKIDDVDLQLLP